MSAGRDKGPLRRVVGHTKNEYGCWVEKLECGHLIHARRDIFGITNAERRRCHLCRRDEKRKAESAEKKRLQNLVTTPPRGDLRIVRGVMSEELKKRCWHCEEEFETADEKEVYCLWCRTDIQIQNEIDSLRGG